MIIFMTGTVAKGQVLEQMLASADQSYAQKDYYDALVTYNQAIAKGESSVHTYFVAAESARHIHAYNRAAELYRLVLKKDKNDDYPLARYHLGTMLWKQGKYVQAKAFLTNFAKRYDGENPYYVKSVNNILSQIEYARQDAVASEGIYTIEQMSDEFNTDYSETGATRIYDRLYYTSFRFADDAEKRLKARPLYSQDGGSPVVDDRFGTEEEIIGNLAFDQEENIVYYSKCRYNDSLNIVCDIYAREYGENLGSEKQITRTPENYTSTQPTVVHTEEGTKLIFSSNRPGSIGGMDLWVSDITSTGTLGPAKNLSYLNSIADEGTPFFSDETSTLYYSSDGLIGSGGFDIFQSALVGSELGKPINMGLPLNTSYDDFYFTVYGSEGYLSSNRPGSKYLDSTVEACCYDLYSVTINPEIKLILTFEDGDGNPIQNVHVTIESPEESYDKQVGKTDKLTLSLKPPVKYGIRATTTDLSSRWVTIDTHGMPYGQVLQRTILLEDQNEKHSPEQKNNHP